MALYFPVGGRTKTPALAIPCRPLSLHAQRDKRRSAPGRSTSRSAGTEGVAVKNTDETWVFDWLPGEDLAITWTIWGIERHFYWTVQDGRKVLYKTVGEWRYTVWESAPKVA